MAEMMDEMMDEMMGSDTEGPEIVIEYASDTEEVYPDGEEEDSEPEWQVDYNAQNLVTEFVRGGDEGDSELKKLADKFIEDFDEAWESGEEYRERRAKEWKFFSGDMDKKSFPWEGCANVWVPIMLENISRVVTRAYAELFPDWDNVFGVLPTGPEDEAIAMALTVHGNWQIRDQISNFAREQHRALLMFFAHGDAAGRSYYCESKQQNRHEALSSDEFVIPYARVTTESDYSDLPYLCLKLSMYSHELKERRAAWHGVDELLDGVTPKWSSDLGDPLHEAAEKATGLVKPDSDRNAPYTIIQYEGWADLPQQDRPRYVQAFVEYETRQVLYLTIHEEPNWQDLQRYNEQMDDLVRYRTERAAYEMATQAQQQVGMANALAEQDHQQQMGLLEEEMAASAAVDGTDIAGAQDAVGAVLPPPEPMQPPPLPPAPVAPSWMADPEDPLAAPEPPRQEPIRLFYHAVCIESLAGNLGISYGTIQAALNEGANTLMNQFGDAATMGNGGMYAAAPNVDFLEMPVELKPGKILRLRSLGAARELKEAIVPFEFKPANPQLVQLADKFYTWAQSSMQAPSILSGEPGKSGETYRGVAARIEQATKQLSVFTGKFAKEYLENELKCNAKLNAKFLREEELFYVTNHLSHRAELGKVRREWYARGYNFRIRADLRFSTQTQRTAEADEMAKMVASDPLLANNYRLQYEVRKRAFLARGRDDLLPFLGAPPEPSQTFPAQPPQPPPGAMPPQGPPQPGGPPPMGAPPGAMQQGGPQ